MSPQKRRVLVIGGQFGGTFVARDLKKHFNVTVVDAKEFFEYTPGVLRAYVKPAHLDALTFTLQPVLERKMGVKYIWGEVKQLDGEKKIATIKTMFSENLDTIGFDYCIICAGCNFGPFQPMGESLWFPVVHEEARKVSQWAHIDERFLEGRRRHILEEYHAISELEKKKATVLVVGAGFIGVEWVTELEYFFPDLETTIIDFLPRCLGPLPEGAAEYCSEYMNAAGVKEFYNCKYDPKSDEFWKSIELPGGADKTYVCIGVKASNYFMPQCVLSDKGPGGGGWIHFNKYMQVVKKPTEGGEVWGDGTIFAVGDCNYGCLGEPPNWEMPPVPKISYPGEEQALHAANNLERMDAMKYGRSGCRSICPKPKNLKPTWWPWGAGMFATSLGPHDACFVMAANDKKGSGYMVNWWYPAALQKEIIETTKINECQDKFIGKMIWHFVHHTPCNLWGRGPWIP
jgi:NADH dehydrogenase FAD-containing subunit